MSNKELLSEIYSQLESLVWLFDGSPAEAQGVRAAIREIEKIEKNLNLDD